ncbi:MAG: 4Fe-4S binding protein, partial [Candidatus Omnitrophota bacterium]
MFLFVYVLWSTTYPMKGVIRPETLFLADPNIQIFTSVSERVFLPGLVWSAGVLVLILIFGRFFCGWICPLGTTIDAAGSCARNVKMPFPGKASKVRLIKYLVLGAVLIASLASFQVAWVCDPLVIMARFVSLNLIPAVTFAVDRTFSFVITKFQLYGGAYDLYSAWKSSFLGVKVYYFSNAGMILAFFLFSVLTAVLSARFWCRVICPLGAMYSLVSKFCGLRRVVVKCNGCGRCVKGCRMNAIRDDLSYDSGECILCMDCVYGCPVKGTKFAFGPYSGYLPEREGGTGRTKGGISRKDFLFLVVSSIFFAGFGMNRRGSPPVSGLIRPPGALPEK